MGTYRFQHTINDIDNLSRDRYVNTWYGHWAGVATELQLTAAATAVNDFYTTTTGGFSLSDAMAGHLGGIGSATKVYDVNTSDVHPPLLTVPFTWPALEVGTLNLPSECAIVLSYSARQLSNPGIKVGRLRGRIYLGPLNTNAIQNGALGGGMTLPAMVKVTVQTGIVAHAQKLYDDFAAAGGIWVVNSPTTMKELGGGPFTFGVEDVYVDNAVDIQRRRGVRATARVAEAITI